AGAQQLGHGQGYRYAHDAPEGIVEQDYLGVERQFYHPTPRGWEARQAERLHRIRQQWK
ncbi:MAG: replication-associated recombination protein A, partial [Planctomycetales bacterium]|nr:replication-associated recombination protein A [Planctomycetales bacterium]